ncbi:MAG: NCS2 family permease, partial [Clostridia bacterium]|nr:NCS2 family permease [Clostridia bacterium]
MSEETKDKVSETEVKSNTLPEGAPAPDGTATEHVSPYKGFWGKVDKFFGISKLGSKYRTEVVAGLTTFMAMVYILMVNAGMFKEVIGGSDPYGAAYIATAIGAVAGTLLMAFLAKMPLAQASGMGVNAFIVYTLVLGGTGLTYANCMVFTLLDGVIFLILTATGLRKKIFEAIPAGVRHAIPVGIGLFIAYIGLQGAGVITTTATATPIYNDLGEIIGYTGGVDANTISGFVSFNVLADGFTYGGIIAPLVAILGVIAIAIMSKKNVKGAILWGILGTTVLYYVLSAIGFGVGDTICKDMFGAITISNPLDAFKAWGLDSAGKVFYEGFDFSNYFGFSAGNNAGTLVVLIITTALSLCMIDMFDTIGTLYGACAKGNLLDEKGAPVRMSQMMLSDAIATCVGAVAGTSTVTTFVEASSGVAAGGRTGFTALVTALCFIVAMFLSPLAQLIPSAATATALIWVGVLMMTSVTKIDWSDAGEAIVAFLTFIVMVLGYSISKGIGIG